MRDGEEVWRFEKRACPSDGGEKSECPKGERSSVSPIPGNKNTQSQTRMAVKAPYKSPLKADANRKNPTLNQSSRSQSRQASGTGSTASNPTSRTHGPEQMEPSRGQVVSTPMQQGNVAQVAPHHHADLSNTSTRVNSGAIHRFAIGS